VREQAFAEVPEAEASSALETNRIKMGYQSLGCPACPCSLKTTPFDDDHSPKMLDKGKLLGISSENVEFAIEFSVFSSSLLSIDLISSTYSSFETSCSPTSFITQRERERDRERLFGFLGV